jgi:hypothetical protein
MIVDRGDQLVKLPRGIGALAGRILPLWTINVIRGIERKGEAFPFLRTQEKGSAPFPLLPLYYFKVEQLGSTVWVEAMGPATMNNRKILLLSSRLAMLSACEPQLPPRQCRLGLHDGSNGLF